MIPQKESKLHTKEDRSQGLARGPLVPVSGSGLARHRRSRLRCFPAVLQGRERPPLPLRWPAAR